MEKIKCDDIELINPLFTNGQILHSKSTFLQWLIHYRHVELQGNISLRFSRNSEALVSEFLRNIEKMFLGYSYEQQVNHKMTM